MTKVFHIERTTVTILIKETELLFHNFNIECEVVNLSASSLNGIFLVVSSCMPTEETKKGHSQKKDHDTWPNSLELHNQTSWFYLF